MKATHHLRDLLSGASIVIVGLAISTYCMATLERGTLMEPGPGGFPYVLGLLMVLTGAISLSMTLFGGRKQAPVEEEPVLGLNLRILGLVMISIAAFGLLIESFGLAPACFASVLLASLVARNMSMTSRLVSAVCASGLAVLIFAEILSVPVHIFTWPLEF
ncbi:tripartite tricarboxylate transporter TctB family protein [Neotabrizicola sp. sgz301269]|uniref:tripartite tricarboxylate transporter TctB family protein n=1 Tax=Neotabrizicola sp. sgz301269 TaxID=3276282 RepID=UPI003770598C